jgi:hypothetical protein
MTLFEGGGGVGRPKSVSNVVRMLMRRSMFAISDVAAVTGRYLSED